MKKISYKLEKKIKAKGYPISNKHYLSAHEEADKKEKKKYPKGYEVLKKMVRKEGNTLIGTNTKAGKIEIEKKVPKKYRSELAYHEKTEHKNLKRMNKKGVKK